MKDRGGDLRISRDRGMEGVWGKVFLLLNVFGLSPLYYTGSGPKPSRLLLCYVSLSLAAFLSMFFWVVRSSKAVPAKDQRNLMSIITSHVVFFSGAFLHAATVLLNVFRRGDLVGFHARMRRTDAKGRRQVLLAYLLFGFFLAEFATTLLVDLVFFVGQESAFYIFVGYLPLLSTGLMKVQFLTSAVSVAATWRKVNVSLIEVATGNPRDSAWRLLEIHSTHADLCGQCALINKLYGFQMFATVGSAFATITSEFYYCYVILGETQHENLISDVYFSLQWASFQAFEIFLLVYFCDAVHEEIKEVSRNLSDLYLKTTDKELKKSIRMFSSHEVHEDVRLTACDFFTLDYTLLQMLSAAVASYLVVMIQFDAAKAKFYTNSV